MPENVTLSSGQAMQASSGACQSCAFLAASPSLVLGDHSHISIPQHLALTTLTMLQIQWRRQTEKMSLLHLCIHSHPGPTSP